MLDSLFIGFIDDPTGEVPLFEIVRPFHPKKGTIVFVETLMKMNLSFPPWAKDYHEHDFLTSKYDDLEMCVCGEEKEHDDGDLEEI